MQTAKVTSIDEIRSTVESAVSLFLSTQQERVRNIMINAVKIELKRHGLTRLWCRGYKVYITKYDDQEVLAFDTTNYSLDGCCPKCGESYHRSKLLTVYHADRQEEEHTVGCRNGHIFKVTGRLL